MALQLQFVAVALVLLLLRDVGCADDVPGPVIDTSTGKIQGKLTDKAQVFTSIPYGRPPVGALRWSDPLPAFPWPGILSTREDPPGCPQVVPCELPLPQLICPKKVSEDCLFLNVFAPHNAKPGSGLPVMVFIHGGNFIRGYSGGGLYDGQYIANKTATILVTINYRLGAIGYLVFGEGDDAIRGNYGLKDQRLALEWVRDNIANFGGDPGAVTLFGQSAGAISTALHMASPRSGSLFNKAILESDPFGLELKTNQKALKLGRDLAKELGCKDVACLYSKDIADIAKAQEALLTKIIDLHHVLEVFLQWTPTVDGLDVLDQPLSSFRKGLVAPIPVMIGTTSEETVFFIYSGFAKSISKVELDGLELGIFPSHYSKVHGRFPPHDGDNRPDIAVMGTQFTFSCPTRSAVRGLINATHPPLWYYVFNHSLSFDGWGPDFAFCNGHSCHAVELPFVFHTAELGGFNYTKDELVLADSMVSYWTNFARYGNPNGQFHSRQSKSSLLSWPSFYSAQESDCMRFKTPQNEVIKNYLKEECDFWDTIGYEVP